MKRWTLRILICLILGTITTVAVAWGLAFYHSRNSIETTPSAQAKAFAKQIVVSHNWLNRFGPTTFHYHDAGWHATEVQGSLANDFQRVDRSEGFPVNAEKGTIYPLHQFGYIESGLPLICFEGGVHRRGNTTVTRDWALCAEEDIVLNAGIIPLRPRPIPFVINTALYASLALVLMLVIGRIGRSRWREKHGQCPRCGYDLRGQRDAVGCRPLAIGSDGPSKSQERTASSHPSAVPNADGIE